MTVVVNYISGGLVRTYENISNVRESRDIIYLERTPGDRDIKIYKSQISDINIPEEQKDVPKEL